MSDENDCKHPVTTGVNNSQEWCRDCGALGTAIMYGGMLWECPAN